MVIGLLDFFFFFFFWEINPQTHIAKNIFTGAYAGRETNSQRRSQANLKQTPENTAAI